MLDALLKACHLQPVNGYYPQSPAQSPFTVSNSAETALAADRSWRGQPPGLDQTSLDHGHEPRAVFEQGDVGEDVAVDHEDIGELAGFEGAEFVSAAHDLGAGP